MQWLWIIIIGGIVGWVANAIMRTRTNVWSDIIVGIVGALLARWFFGSVLGIGSALSAGSFTLLGLLWALIGSVVLIAIVRAIMGSYGEERMSGPAYHEEIKKDKYDDSKKNRY